MLFSVMQLYKQISSLFSVIKILFTHKPRIVIAFTRKLIHASATLQMNSQAPQAENTWCMRQFVYIENCMGKSPIVKKLCK